MPYTLQQIQNKTIDAGFDMPAADGSIWEKAAEFNALLAAQDQGAAYELAYQLAMTKARLDTTVQPLLDTIAKAREAGEPLTAGQVAQERKYRDLMAQLDRELDQYATKAGALIRYTNDLAVQSAVEMARQSTLAALQPSEPVSGAAAKVVGTWNELPSDVLKQIVASDATRFLKGLNQETRDKVQVDLLAGVAAGKGQRQIAEAIDRTLGGHLGRAMTIARTEHHRAQREATRATYEANSDIVKGWVWRCSRTGRTCAICWGMDGQEFTTNNATPATPFGTKPSKSTKALPVPATPRMHTHVNCRCTMVPLTRSWAELGYPGIPEIPKPPTGGEVFATLPADVQRSILGPSKYKAFKDGNITLADLIAGGEHPKFGRYRYERSLSDALKAGEDRKEALARNSDDNPDRVLWHQAEEARNSVLNHPDVQELIAAQVELENLQQEIKQLERQFLDLSNKSSKAFQKGDTKEANRLANLRNDAEVQLADKRYDAMAAQNRVRVLNTAVHTQARNILQVSNPVKVRVSMAQDMTTAERTKARDGVDAFNMLVSNPNAETHTLDINMLRGRDQRSYQSPGRGIFMGGYSREATFVHEIGHWLEEHDQGAHQDIIDFLDRRTAGLTPQWLGQGYDKSEIAIADNFINPYVGKEYSYGGKRFASEVLSMGLQAFYEDPVNFARKDPEHFQLTYVIARGGRWNPPPPSEQGGT